MSMRLVVAFQPSYTMFPLNKLHSLPKGYRFRNISDVAIRRQAEIASFLTSLFSTSEEISHCDLVYTFFHSLFRDEQAAIHSSTPSMSDVMIDSSLGDKISGDLKLTILYREGLLELFVNHARNLVRINDISRLLYLFYTVV
ncbi:unnamed protein product [Soboliphyme baturini]|uniref:PX domain-containing protein n=1 Tax=Soboliphyme baturini TaxID=241478 RepID=A0A183IAI1_9BILA|nr:unnamed protein product [Soboliphyme baturini]